MMESPANPGRFIRNQSLSFATNFGSTTQRPRRFDCFALVEAGGVARLSLRPARASAIAARRRADALPCVALFLLPVGALRRFDSPWTPPSAKRPIPCGTWRIGPSVRLVEAGGVEPPSEDSLLRATTCVSGHLGLVPGDPGRQGSLRTIPGEGSPFGPPGGGFRLSRESDLLAPIRAFDGRRQAA